MALLALLGSSAVPRYAGRPAPGAELSFSGSSPAGSFQEALDAALATARTELARRTKVLDFRWELAHAGGRPTSAPDTSALHVSIRSTCPLPPALQKKAGPGGSAEGAGF